MCVLTNLHINFSSQIGQVQLFAQAVSFADQCVHFQKNLRFILVDQGGD